MSDSNTSHEHELPLLGGISALFRWLESLVTIASGPILTVGLAVALVDLLTDGQLLASQPLLLYVWAFSQALGVDTQLVASFRPRKDSVAREAIRCLYRQRAAGSGALLRSLDRGANVCGSAS